jgi:DNA topoisomerase-1
MAVTEALEIHAETITRPEMTATLEKDMDEIARGLRTTDDVIRESQDMLGGVVDVLVSKREEIAKEIHAALDEQNYIGECRRCADAGRENGRIMIRHTAQGRKFLGCTNYPVCRVFHTVPPFGLLVSAEQKCPECASPMVKLLDRKRQDAFCVDPECPSVMKRDRLGACPKDGGDIMLRMSGRGKRFAGCANYPRCDQTYPLPQRGKVEPLGEPCEHCRSPRIQVITMGRPPWLLCINMDCPGKALKAAAKAEKAAAREREKKEKRKVAAAAKRAKARARARKPAKAKAPRDAPPA